LNGSVEFEEQLHFAKVKMMKKRFAKLLLEEEGVCTILAISNGIISLSS